MDVTEVWGVPVRAVHCAHCGEEHLVPADDVSPRCPFCLQGPVTPEPAALPEERPEQILPYEVSESRLADFSQEWVKRWMSTSSGASPRASTSIPNAPPASTAWSYAQSPTSTTFAPAFSA